MAVPVQTIITRFQTVAQDDGTRWPLSEVVDWISEAEQAVVVQRPEAYSVLSTIKLAAGTKQSLAAEDVRLLDVVRNMGATGVAPGRAVTLTDRPAMDANNPDWHTDPADAAVQHYMYSDNTPTTFFVYPPQPATGQGYVEIVTARVPAAATRSGNLHLADTYASVVLDYVLYRAYSKDADVVASAQRATLHYQAFAQALGIEVAMAVQADPNVAAVVGPYAATKKG